MFELKYKITVDDVNSVNKSMMWRYFIPYIAVALLGVSAGIAATVLRPSQVILVLGIILIVLGGILTVCSLLLLIAPKNFVASALLTSSEVERKLTVGESNIVVETEDMSDIIFSYGEITKVKNKKTYIVCFIGREQILIIKDAFIGKGSIDELYEFLKSKTELERPDAPAEPESEETPTGEEAISKEEEPASVETPASEDTIVNAETQASEEAPESEQVESEETPAGKEAPVSEKTDTAE